jgi:hypothetical protein
MRIRQIFLFSVALGSTMGAMAAVLFAAQQWSAFEAARTVESDTRLLERMLRVPEMMNMERAFINIRMIDAHAASPTQLATLLRQTNLVDLAISDARKLTAAPDDAIALRAVEDRLLDVRQAALAAIVLPLADRSEAQKAAYLARMFAVQEAVYNQVTDLQERINAVDPRIGQSTRLARLAWDVRDWTGRQTTTLIDDLGRGLPLSGSQAEVLAEFKGRIEQKWAAVRYTAGQLKRPEITAVLARVDHRYWAGGGEAYTTYVASGRDHLLGVDLDSFALAVRPILDSVLELRDSAMREALRQSAVDVAFRKMCLLAALGLVILIACTIAAATWWFDRRVVRGRVPGRGVASGHRGEPG